MTEGKVVLLGPDLCWGWAKSSVLPRYAVTVHLVLHDRVLASAIADQSPRVSDAPTVSGDCWFEIDVPSRAAEHLAECRVLVGESGVYLKDIKQDSDAEVASAASTQRPMSFRDALDRGLNTSDVIELLYLDILRRPADKVGLRFHLSELESGRGSLESFRRSLLASDEYRRLMLRVREAPGGTFARGIAYLSSTRRMEMEQHAAAFQRISMPLHQKLLDFFPGIVMMPGAITSLVALASKGFPEREIFFRALGALSRRPSLIVADRREVARDRRGLTAADKTREITLDCASPLFAAGWNKLERSATKTYRWMEQVGILLNPSPEQRIELVEVSAEEWYGNLDRTITALANGTVLSCERHNLEGGRARLAFKTPDGSPFSAPHIALVASAAACPWSYDGTPDMRLVSCQISAARFQYGEEAA